MRVWLLRRNLSRSILLAVAGGSMVACTLLNSLEDVRPQKAAVSGEDGSVPSEASAGDAAPTDSGGGNVDSGVDAGPQKGAIVIGGTSNADGGSTTVLTALAPEDGTELPKAREAMTVAAARYDGIRDLWYLFENGGEGFFPLPTDPVFLHVRNLETHSGTWGKRDTLKVPPIVSFTHVAVLRNRLAYIAYREGGKVTDTDLVVIDTTNPDSVKVLFNVPLPLKPIGVLGSPSDTQNGGSLNLLLADTCPTSSDPDAAPAGRCLSSQHYIVAAEGEPTASAVLPLGPYAGTPAFGSYRSRSIDLVGAKLTNSDPQLSIHSIDPTNNTLIPGTTDLQVNDAFLKPLAIDECRGLAFLCGTNQDLNVYAIPLTTTTGQLAKSGTKHSGQGVYYEPYTNTVLAPFSQGAGFTLTAMTVGGTAANPTLSPPRGLTDWAPPSDLAPEIVAIRAPLSLSCP
jgi:hypothetical protein